MSEIVDIAMPAEGVFHNLVLVSIHKRFPGHARKVINGLWGLGLMMLTRCIVVFDADVDVQSTSTAMFHALSNVDWAHDIVVQEGPTDASGSCQLPLCVWRQDRYRRRPGSGRERDTHARGRNWYRWPPRSKRALMPCG